MFSSNLRSKPAKLDTFFRCENFVDAGDFYCCKLFHVTFTIQCWKHCFFFRDKMLLWDSKPIWYFHSEKRHYYNAELYRFVYISSPQWAMTSSTQIDSTSFLRPHNIPDKRKLCFRRYNFYLDKNPPHMSNLLRGDMPNSQQSTNTEWNLWQGREKSARCPCAPLI